ncbi:MAG: hypothetical protein KKE17_06600 [Proteobacteria bacterium]|nr:hypothetical protein [Pseudomonadota bacterium]MBU1709657.1 hypothetical protein [Pseudomonadota bacterium]
MQKEIIKQKYRSFLKEIETDLQGKAQGYMKTLKIGKKIFPFCISPQIEVILLDPEDQTIIYRRTSDPDALIRKKGEWIVGKPLDVVCNAINWAELMKRQKQ